MAEMAVRKVNDSVYGPCYELPDGTRYVCPLAAWEALKRGEDNLRWEREQAERMLSYFRALLEVAR